MKLIIPMAGLGKRMRPHTLTVPKPLLQVADKSIVERIIINFSRSTGKRIEEIHYVIGHFGSDVELKLLAIAESLNAKGFIHYQEEALGTAHAVYCAKSALEGEVCIAFADTMYYGNIEIEPDDEAIIWTYQVDDPSNYGVVITDERNVISDFKEKPSTPISNHAIVGLYYFRKGENLREDIKHLIESNSKTGGEFQLTDNLKNLVSSGLVFKNKNLTHWLDYGNKSVFVDSSATMLELESMKTEESFPGSKIINPVYIGDNVEISDSVIGPHVIIGNSCKIEGSTISKTVVGEESTIKDTELNNSLIGNYVNVSNFNGVLNLGDYNEVES